MRKTLVVLGAWLLIALFAPIAGAQGTGRIDGEIIGRDGAPYANMTVLLKNPETGQTFTLKTDKSGKFIQLALRSGVYTVTLPDINYTEKYQIKDGEENDYKLNLKELAAKSGADNPEEAKKKEAEEDKFKNMKAHFEAGVAAMNSADGFRTQLKTATPDQRSALQSQRTAACVTAATEFSSAEQGVTAKDINNHAMVLGNLGQAQECSGKYDDAAAAFQKAIDLKPAPGYYTGLATNLANVGAALNDPAASAQKFADAASACEKGSALDTATPNATPSDACWKNLGIVLSNKGRLKEAIPPLQKATATDPKDQQAWYLLGGAYTGTIDTKQEGDKMIYIIPPGTKEAYQKCIDLGADNGLGKACKESMDGLAAMGGGEDTSVGKRKKKS
jgi:tetratricopeptide (TPR) repeat protein